MWEEGTVAPLPTTITYTTEAELRELEMLRTEVALLQQESCLEQVKVSPSTCSDSTLSGALCKQPPLLPLFAGSVGPSDPSAVLFNFGLSQCQCAERCVLSAG